MALEQYIRADMYHPEDRDEIISGQIDEAREKLKELYPDIDWFSIDCFEDFEKQYGTSIYEMDEVLALYDALDMLDDCEITGFELLYVVKFNDLQQFILARFWCENECPGDVIDLAADKWSELDVEEQDDFVESLNRETIGLSSATLDELYETCKNNSWNNLLQKYNMEFPRYFWGTPGDKDAREYFNTKFIEEYNIWKEQYRDEYPNITYMADW